MIGQSPKFTVSEFVAIFNQSLEMMYPQITVVGELSNFKVSKGKWVYFDLKDEYSSVKFFGTVYALPGPLEDGVNCEVIGRPRLHNKFGFSINYESVRPVGEGSIKKLQELLFKKLEAEGLFSQDRKRYLPFAPQRIGLITSGESAAIADFKKIVNVRWPFLEIELIDTLVQGDQAPAAIAGAIQHFNLASSPPEVLVIIRGGGSADDLAAFSEESVVRAVAASRVPTIVAIGHENDVSLAELAADQRASTPSNAAELLVPDIINEKQLLTNNKKSLETVFKQFIKDENDFLDNSKRNLEQLLKDIRLDAYQELERSKILLNALDPLLPLKKGYVIVRDRSGTRIKSAKQLVKANSDILKLQFTDEEKQINVKNIE